MCCSPWGCKESDTTERLNWTEEHLGKVLLLFYWRWNESIWYIIILKIPNLVHWLPLQIQFISCLLLLNWASLVVQTVRIHLQWSRPGFDPWIWKIPWRRKWQPTLVFLTREFHRQSLMGYSPWGCKELDTTEWLPLLSNYGAREDSWESLVQQDHTCQS